MTWVFVVCAVLGLGIAAVLISRGLATKAQMHEFEHWVHSFMKVKKDGASLTLTHVDSVVLLRFRREEGSNGACTLLLDVPRARWSEAKLDTLRELIERRGKEPISPTDNPGVLLRVRLRVADIWDEASGAAGARLAQDLLRCAGLGNDARFSVAMGGENSSRIRKRLSENEADRKSR